MEQVHSSFIPKSTLAKPPRARKHPVSFLLVVAILLFILACVAWGLAYVYKGYVTSQVKTLSDSLTKKQAAFEPETLAALSELDRKMRAGDALLAQHVTLVPIFDELEKMTIQSIRFTSFTYERGLGVPDKVVMTGEAKSYAAIALQSDELAKNKKIVNPIFSGLSVDRDANVAFSLTFNLDSELTSYVHDVGEPGATPGTGQNAPATQGSTGAPQSTPANQTQSQPSQTP